MSAIPSSPELTTDRDNTSSVSQPKKKQRLDASLDNSANACQPTTSGNISQTLSLFECCVCLDYITPPILQCRNSHVFCKTCRQKFEKPPKCPTCRETLHRKDSRNHSLEQIAGSLGLKFPCKYSLGGCDVTLVIAEKAEHEDLCEHKPFRCPSLSGECQWSGSREEVAQHLIDEHKYRRRDCQTSYQKVRIIDREVKRCKSFGPQVMNHKNSDFVVIKRFDNTSKLQFKAVVLFVGEQKDANQFNYKIEIINQSNGTQLQWIETPISIRNDIKSVLSCKNNDGLTLDEKLIDKLSSNNSLIIRITIESEELQSDSA